VPVVAIPISLIGALFLMQVLGFTLNLLTLLAIVLSVGLVVDDAIVVVENVERHMREGLFREMKRRRAYEKPSERRVREKAEAIRRHRKMLRKRLEREGY